MKSLNFKKIMLFGLVLSLVGSSQAGFWDKIGTAANVFMSRLGNVSEKVMASSGSFSEKLNNFSEKINNNITNSASVALGLGLTAAILYRLVKNINAHNLSRLGHPDPVLASSVGPVIAPEGPVIAPEGPVIAPEDQLFRQCNQISQENLGRDISISPRRIIENAVLSIDNRSMREAGEYSTAVQTRFENMEQVNRQKFENAVGTESYANAESLRFNLKNGCSVLIKQYSPIYRSILIVDGFNNILIHEMITCDNFPGQIGMINRVFLYRHNHNDGTCHFRLCLFPEESYGFVDIFQFNNLNLN